MASAPSGTNGGRCESNIVSAVLLVFVVMPSTLGASRSSDLDHSSSDSLYHFGQRFQRPGPRVRRGSGVPGDQRLGGQRLPFPYAAVAHDVAALAAPLHPAALELLVVQLGVEPALAEQVLVRPGLHQVA